MKKVDWITPLVMFVVYFGGHQLVSTYDLVAPMVIVAAVISRLAVMKFENGALG